MQKRNTSQKKIVYDALDELGHASTETLIEFIKMQHAQISLATIYRNIASLLEDQLIKRVKLNHQDVLETVKSEHAHFVCEVCGNILDMKLDKQDLLDMYAKETQHQLKKCDIAFYGLCQNCQQEKENKI